MCLWFGLWGSNWGCEAFSDCQESRTCAMASDDVSGSSGAAAGGVGGQGGSVSVATPAAVEVAVTFGIKAFQFSWDEVSGATFYRLLRQEGSSWQQEGADSSATTARVEVPLHLYDFGSALYRVDACNESGCTPSNPVNVSDAAIDSVGYFKGSMTSSDEYFGADVAFSKDGRFLAVGRPFGRCADAQTDAEGSVVVFERTASGWVEESCAMLDESDYYSYGFGAALAIDAAGDTLLISAVGELVNATAFGGRAYLYERDGGSWTKVATLEAPARAGGDSFGASVSLNDAGTVMAIGAPGRSAKGAAYVFVREGALVGPPVTITAPFGDTNDRFGESVSLSRDGKSLAIGAPSEDGGDKGLQGDEQDDTQLDSGAVYVFRSNGALWNQQAYVKASNTQAGDRFGAGVSLDADGSTLAVGASNEASDATGVDGDQVNDAAPGSGAVYVFARNGTAWTQQAYLKASAASPDAAFFNVSLSASGDVLAVGAPSEASGGSGVVAALDRSGSEDLESGAAFVFARETDSWVARSTIKGLAAASGDRFGHAVCLSADGGTLAVGAPYEKSVAVGIGGDPTDDQPTYDLGAVYLY